MKNTVDTFRPISSNGFPEMQISESGVYVHLVDYFELEARLGEAVEIMKEAVEDHIGDGSCNCTLCRAERFLATLDQEKEKSDA